MKKLLTAYLLLLCIGMHAQSNESVGLSAQNDTDITTSTNNEVGEIPIGIVENETEDEIIKTFKENKIASRRLDNLNNALNGYYIVISVNKSTRNLKKNIKKFKKKGFAPGYATAPDSGLNYFYLERFDKWQDALEACTSNLGGTYPDDKWVMIVKDGATAPVATKKRKRSSKLNRYESEELVDSNKQKANTTATNETPLAIETVSYDMLTAETSSNPKQKAKDPVNQSKIIQKADLYFNKMWYAEAAELYELALKKEGNQSFDILQKAGDSHYFNTNMEKAYQWYNILYENYKDDMSADNLFKYAHTLKGTGKYGRAKRLMRLYNKKRESGEASAGNDYNSRPTPNEVVLDNILNTEASFGIKNLAINTEYSEFSPMFHNGDQVVYASAKDSSFFHTRRYKWNNQPYLDLYVAKMNEESEDLKNAVKFSKEINTKYHEASVTFSPDNTTMYFTRNNYGKKLKRDDNGINHLKIYKSEKIDGEWTEATEVAFNSDNYSTGHPALSPDGKQLYFVSDMPGSIGQTDIFVVDVLEDGSFSEPRNLGPNVNTEKKEMFPFINDKKLYFSSNGHGGLGGLDVFEVAFEEEEGFLEARNLGQPINSNKDDFSYIVDEETQKGFFASNRPGGKGDDDIYSFQRLIVEETNENAIAGVVTEMVTGDVMPEALVMLLDENNIKLKEVMTDDEGSFVFEDLDSTTKYTIKTVKGSYFDDEQIVETKENEVVNADVSMKKLKELIAIEDGIRKLKTDIIYFDFDKSYIRDDASKELDKLVEVMTEYQDMVIKIESHTDSRGKKSYNKYLSDKRAKSTRDYLIAQGIEPERIESAIGYGEERLLNECNGSVRCSSQQHQVNRRSEFIIVKM